MKGGIEKQRDGPLAFAPKRGKKALRAYIQCYGALMESRTALMRGAAFCILKTCRWASGSPKARSDLTNKKNAWVHLLQSARRRALGSYGAALLPGTAGGKAGAL